MPANLLRYEALPPAARDDAVRLPLREQEVEVVLRRRNGQGEVMRIPEQAAGLLLQALDSLLAGRRVALLEEEAELSPNEAAEILGISRPLVVRRMELGELPFRLVGAHRRCTLRDVLALRQRLERQQAAMRALVEEGERLEEEYGL